MPRELTDYLYVTFSEYKQQLTIGTAEWVAGPGRMAHRYDLRDDGDRHQFGQLLLGVAVELLGSDEAVRYVRQYHASSVSQEP